MFDKTDQLAVDTIRTLSIDAVEEAQSGHTGLPLGAAPMIYTLWSRHYSINPQHVNWFNRDRFILSAGHGSAMLYSLLHLSGFDLSISDLKKFRKLGSKTPGHPEVLVTEGVEVTTGPLGQGFANGVGMAMAEVHLAAKYNKINYPVIDHYTYVLVSDGDLQEGISHEAASLAGHLALGKLIVLYDSNDTQIEGPTNETFSEDIEMRFKSYKWDYYLVEAGNDLEAINKAIQKAKEVDDKPSIIEVKTEIGYGTPNVGTSNAHSDPIGAVSVASTKNNYNWEYDSFTVPKKIYKHFQATIKIPGEKNENAWNKLLEEYGEEYPKLAKELKMIVNDGLPKNWRRDLPIYEANKNGYSTREISGKFINVIAKKIPNFWGGSADLSESTKTRIHSSNNFSSDNYEGKNILYGVREHAMAAVLNGILLHGGTKSFISTYFVFSDYLRPSIRLAALSRIPAIYVFTHDSVAVGEDGSTHEPVEHLSSYRGMPNLTVFRPADANEVISAWKIAITSTDRPTMIVLTRQVVPVLENTKELAEKFVGKGAYIISSAKKKANGILLATGSEVHLAINAQKELFKKGHDVSVVSMPSLGLFKLQSEEYKESVLPRKLTRRLAIEMGSSFGWGDYVGLDGEVLSLDRFGASGSGDELVRKLGYTVDTVVNKYLSLIE